MTRVNNLDHSVNDTLPMNLAVLSKPELFTMKKIQADFCSKQQTVPAFSRDFTINLSPHCKRLARL